MADPPTNALASNGHRFVCHHLGPHTQSVLRGGIYRYPKIRCIGAFRGHLADYDGRMRGRQRIRLHNHCGTRFAVVASRCNGHDVAAPHSESNSDTVSIHRMAPASSDRFRPATCMAMRLRTAFKRASGTIKRNSRRPLARRRSRIALIRSAVRAMILLRYVTRFSVTRDGQRIKEQRTQGSGSLVPEEPMGSEPKSSAAPFHSTWMPMQKSRNAERRTMMVVPVAPMTSASRAEWR